MANLSACEEYRPLVSRYFPASQVDTFLRVMKAESGCRPDAKGDGHLAYYQGGVQYGASYGLAQVRYLPGRLPPAELVKPEVNIATAHRMWKASGYSPWSVCKNGKVRCH